MIQVTLKDGRIFEFSMGDSDKEVALVQRFQTKQVSDKMVLDLKNKGQVPVKDIAAMIQFEKTESEESTESTMKRIIREQQEKRGKTFTDELFKSFRRK
jgi:hypothetical protein